MTLRSLLAVSAALTLGFGLFALVAPSAMGAIYGNPTGPDATLWARYFGSAVSTVGLVTVLAVRWPDERVRDVLALLPAAFFGVNLVISLGAQWRGVVNALGWTNIALQAFMSAALAVRGVAGLRAPDRCSLGGR